MKHLALSLLLAATAVQAQDLQPVKDAGPYVPSPQSVVSDMLRYADVGPSDFLIDLGSGDGRIVLTAAKVFGARGFGVEIKDELVKKSNEAAKNEGLADRVKFMKQDLFKTDMSQATVITMYLLPDTVNLLKDKFLAELKPGTRIVSHDYPLTGWIPEKYVQMDLEDKVQISGVTTTLIYLYVVPAKVAGSWKAQMPAALSKQPATLSLKQQLTRVSGSVRLDGKDFPMEDVKLRGDQLSFKLAGRKGEFSGQVKGKQIEGTVQTGGAKSAWSATLGGMKLRISAAGVSFEVVLKETPTAKALLAAVPFESRAQTWGEEVYFSTPVSAKLEPDAKQVVEPGTVCFWTEGDALALPWGRTPISTDEKPKLASRCNIVGTLSGDAKNLSRIRSGEKISVTKA